MSVEARDYQLQLLEHVTKKNAIIFLPTGSGKTLVAFMAIKRYSSTLLKPIDEGGKRAIFMCPTVELARQQQVELKKYCNLKVGLYTGEKNVDTWCKEKWQKEIEEYQVLVGTAQVFVDVINYKMLEIKNLSIVVIDECHNATGSHPMHQFLSFFQIGPKSIQPRIIGLTGVLLKGNKINNLEKNLKALEASFRGNIVTVANMEEYHNVLLYSTKPHETCVIYHIRIDFHKIIQQVKHYIDECIAMLDNWTLNHEPDTFSKGLMTARDCNKKVVIRNSLNDFVYQLNQLGMYCAKEDILLLIIEFEVQKRQSALPEIRDLYRCIITKCDLIRHVIVKYIATETDKNEANAAKRSIDAIYRTSTPKFQALMDYMKRTFSGMLASDVSCLIFVKRRRTAKCVFATLMSFITQSAELVDVLRPDFIVGHHSTTAIQTLLDCKWTKDALHKFHKKETNLLVCSNVLEEGIDIRSCNYVIAFDLPDNFSSYIQMKGRARSNDSHYVLFMADEDSAKSKARINNYNITHEKLKRFLVGRTLDRLDPTESEIAQEFMEDLKPIQMASGTWLNGVVALTTINRYCQKLPNDAFGTAGPWFKKISSVPAIRVSLRLPLQSSVKDEIIGDECKNVKLAKMSAAMKACLRLHANGELNDHLIPTTATECLAKVSSKFFEHWQPYKEEYKDRSVGCKRHRRLVDRLCPMEFYQTMPIVGETCYMYEIRIVPVFERNELNEHIVNLLTMPNNYALLVRRPLPALAVMPLFMTQGPIKVHIARDAQKMIIANAKDLEMLCQHHMMIFRDILNCWRKFLCFDRRNKENSYLVVPIDNGNIDWHIIREFQQLMPLRKYSADERKGIQYNANDYIGRIVHTWYSLNQDDRYVVTRILNNETPLSKFTNEHYASYADFIEKKYEEYVMQPQQFLIEVKALTTRRNFFINAKGKFSNNTLKKQMEIILIPEMCHNFRYPATLWLKALLLPSILHRLHFMLHAERLRCTINKHFGFVYDKYTPKQLMIDVSLKRIIGEDGIVLDTEEKCPSLLPAMPTVMRELDIFSLDTKMPWKTFMEPINSEKSAEKIYMLEVVYYYKFCAGLLHNLKRYNSVPHESNENNSVHLQAAAKQTLNNNSNNNLDDDDNGDGTVVASVASASTSIESHKNILLPSMSSLTSSISHLRCIEDVPLEERRRIKILELDITSSECPSSAEQCEFLAALTTAEANDVFDMERFELLGDSFLKFSISLLLMKMYPTWNEGVLTKIKSQIVSNRNLLYCMMLGDIHKCIALSAFKPNHEWLPPLASLPRDILAHVHGEMRPQLFNISPYDLYSLDLTDNELQSGNCTKKHLTEFIENNLNHNLNLSISNRKSNSNGNGNGNGTNTMMLLNTDTSSSSSITDDYVAMSVNPFIYKDIASDKVVADALEAILGVCINNYGIERSFRLLKYFGICNCVSDDYLCKLSRSAFKSPLIQATATSSDVDEFLVNHEILEQNLGYTFRNRAYLLQALTHPSFPANRITGCYQELEFLGDAILDVLVSSYIFEHFETLTPGKLTDLRSALVNNITLSCICVRHRFHLFMLSENALLSQAIRTFADYQLTQNDEINDLVWILLEEHEQERVQANERAENIAANVDVPKTLGDIVEALIAAVYLDSQSLSITWTVIYQLFERELNRFVQNVPIDAIRQLYERKGADPKFSELVKDDENIMVTCSFISLNERHEVHGFGGNKTQAKRAAAKHALRILNKH